MLVGRGVKQGNSDAALSDFAAVAVVRAFPNPAVLHEDMEGLANRESGGERPIGFGEVALVRPHAPEIAVDEVAALSCLRVELPTVEARAAVVAGVPAAGVGGISGDVVGVGGRAAGDHVRAADDNFIGADVKGDAGDGPRRSRRNAARSVSQLVAPRKVAGHAIRHAGKGDAGRGIGDRADRRRIGDGQARRGVRAFRDGKVPVGLIVVVPSYGAIVEDHVDVGGARERGVLIGPVGTGLGHGGVGLDDILPAVAPDVDKDRIGALQDAPGGIVGDGDGRARGGGADLDRAGGLGRIAATRDVDVPIRAVVVVPDAAAIVEHHINGGGVGWRVVGVFPVVALLGHGRVGGHDILPAVAPDVDFDARGILERAFVGVVADDHRVTTIWRCGVEDHAGGPGRGVAVADGNLPIVAAVVFPIAAVVERDFDLRRIVGDGVGREGIGEGVGAGAGHRHRGPVVGVMR